jgi:phage baseplate assembly protein W
MSRTAVYSDLDMELSRQTDGDLNRQTELDAVINSLTNIVSTLQGSRRMLPEFAQDLWALLFEPVDETTSRLIGERILDAITFWDDRVNVTNLRIQPKYDDGRYDITLNFNIKSIKEDRTIDFVLYAQ